MKCVAKVHVRVGFYVKSVCSSWCLCVYTWSGRGHTHNIPFSVRVCLREICGQGSCSCWFLRGGCVFFLVSVCLHMVRAREYMYIYALQCVGVSARNVW